MKTITLEEAYKRATKGPLQTVDHEIISNRGAVIAFCYDRGDTMAESNSAILAHCFNMLPEVVDALREAFEDICATNKDQELIDRLDAALTKASTVEVPE